MAGGKGGRGNGERETREKRENQYLQNHIMENNNNKSKI